jgi:hypothetical protein
MTDNLTKLRALLTMKSTLLETFQKDLAFAQDLVEALRGDLEHAVNLIQRKDDEINRLNEELLKERMKEWEAIDRDEEWLAEYLARDEGLSLAEQRERDGLDEYGGVIANAHMTVLGSHELDLTHLTDDEKEDDYDYEEIPF